MKAAEIRELSAEDLQVKLKEAKAELFNLRFQLAGGHLETKVKELGAHFLQLLNELSVRELTNLCGLH